MKICPRCNFYNQEQRNTCLKCGWALDKKDVEYELPKPKNKSNLYIIPRSVRHFTRKIKGYLKSDIPDDVPHRFPFVAATLGLFFGLGQVYNHQYKKAVFFLIGHIIALYIVISTITASYSNLIILLYAGFVLSAYNDAFVTALKINGQQWTLRYTIAALSGFFFVLGLGIILGQFFFSPFFKIIIIAQDAVAPTLRKGDVVYVDCMGYWFGGKPRRGDIIFYNPEPFNIEVPGGGMDSPVYNVREKRTFERVLGIPGDKVERRDGDFYVNGREKPSWYQPMNPENVFENMSFEVPSGRFLAIYSHSPKDLLEGALTGVDTIPKLTAPGVILKGWEDTCMVEEKRIIGRAVLILNPPKRRRILLPP